jgi:hypothetical protein
MRPSPPTQCTPCRPLAPLLGTAAAPCPPSCAQLGVLAEFSGDWGAALAQYGAAHRHASGLAASLAGAPQRYLQARGAAEYAHAKVGPQTCAARPVPPDLCRQTCAARPVPPRGMQCKQRVPGAGAGPGC